MSHSTDGGGNLLAADELGVCKALVSVELSILVSRCSPSKTAFMRGPEGV